MDLRIIGLGYLVGFIVWTPCIIPIMPVILFLAVQGSYRRAYGIAIGFVFSYSLFSLSRINLESFKPVSLILLFLMGIILFSSTLTDNFIKLRLQLTNFEDQKKSKRSSTFLRGILLGTFIGLIWTPCAAPGLVTTFSLLIEDKSIINNIAMIIGFYIGALVFILGIIAWLRSDYVSFNLFNTTSPVTRKIFGGLILLSTVYITFAKITPLFDHSI